MHFDQKAVYDFQLEKTPDMKVLMKKFKKDFDTAEPKPMTVTLDVGNTDRAFGTIFGSEITAKFGNTLPEDTFHRGMPRRWRPELWRLYPHAA